MVIAVINVLLWLTTISSLQLQPTDACPEKLIPSRHLNNNQQSVGSVTEKLGAGVIAGTLCEGIVIL